MKKYILTVTLLAAFASACAEKAGTPAANNSLSNANSPTNATNTAVKTENSPAANSEKNTKAASTKTEKTTDAGLNPERVQFAAGKNEATLKRTIPANGSIDFVTNAKSGQRMQYSAIPNGGSDTDIGLFLTEPGLQDISNTAAGNEPVEFMIKKTGDHRITVNNNSGKPVTVDFGIAIK